jgi:hypothetical protein
MARRLRSLRGRTTGSVDVELAGISGGVSQSLAGPCADNALNHPRAGYGTGGTGRGLGEGLTAPSVIALGILREGSLSPAAPGK